MPAAGGETASITGEGTASFGEISFTAPGEYEYLVAETNSGELGYTYAPEYEVTAEVVDENGSLKIAKLYYDGVEQTIGDDGAIPDLAFTNTYEAVKTHVELGVTKAIEGCPRTEGLEKSFTFHLSPVGDAPMPATVTGALAVVTDEGDATFDRINFTKPGTYLYKIHEGTDVVDTEGGEHGDDADNGVAGASAESAGFAGYTYDAKVVYAQVVVSDHGGTLAADSVEYGTMTDGVFAADADQAAAKTFTNIYAPTAAKVVLPVQKVIEGADRPAGSQKDFEFTLTGNDGAPMPEGTGNVISVSDGGTASFGEITFSRPGTYTYTVSETNKGDAGYTYADPQTVTVTVADEDGWLKAVVAVDSKGALNAGADLGAELGKIDGGLPEGGQADATVSTLVFTNSYAPLATDLELPVEKKIEGAERTNGTKDFTFTLAADDEGAPMPVDGGQTVSINDEGDASFGAISFEKADTYHYTVTEENGGAAGYTYAEPHHVTVTVTNNDGRLEAAWTDDADAGASKVTFTNGYAPAAAELSLPISKKIEGDKPASDEAFQFRIEGADGAPMPESELASVTGEGTASFGAIAFDEPGTYGYKVSEVAGDAAGFTYDETVYDVEVTVIDNDGALEATWTANGEAAITFTNKYSNDEAGGGEGGGGKTTKKPTTKAATASKAAASQLSTTGDYLAVGAVALGVVAAIALVVALVMKRRRKADGDDKGE